jgi:polyisoprenoid-binding protein YceI
MNATQLQQLRAEPELPVLINLLPEEPFADGHIPGSLNACVFEVAFIEKMESLVPDKSASVVIYGAGEGSLDAEVALTRLSAAGYTQVSVLDDGLAAWKAAGLPVECTAGTSESGNKLAGSYTVDAAESLIRWTGRNLFNHHSGTLRLASGHLVVEGDQLKSARFEIDMNSIACEDIADAGASAMLIGHLKHSDFFDVANHPTAVFECSSAQKLDVSQDGVPNYRLEGQFSLRGITKPLAFDALIARADSGRLTGQAVLELDRTDYGSQYGSGKFFRFLGKHLVNDHIQLHLKVHANPA